MASSPEIIEVARNVAASKQSAGQIIAADFSDDMRLRRHRKIKNSIAENAIKFTAFLSFTFIILILIFIGRETVPVFTKSSEHPSSGQQEKQETYGEEPTGQAATSGSPQDPAAQSTIAAAPDFFIETWQPVSDSPKYGLRPLIVGTLKVTLIALLIAAPIAILAALFTSTFAPKWAKELLKPCIEILAGFPSVVIGFFALIVLATFLQNLFGFEYRLNAFVGGVAMALAVIPIIFTITEDALTTVPKSFTEASMALGVEKWKTAWFVVLPAATPGIFAAILLGIGRAFGETMIVLMATGNAAMLSANLFEPVRTMSATVGSEMAEVVFGEPHYHILFLIGSILFVFSFTLNVIAEFYVRNKLLKKFKGTG